MFIFYSVNIKSQVWRKIRKALTVRRQYNLSPGICLP